MFDISSIMKPKRLLNSKRKKNNTLLLAEVKYLLIRESNIVKLIIIFYLGRLTLSSLKMVTFNKTMIKKP